MNGVCRSGEIMIMHPRNNSYGKFVNGPRRYGKTLAAEWALRFKIIQTVKCNVPEKPFVLCKGEEIITWLPTGEVISRRIDGFG